MLRFLFGKSPRGKDEVAKPVPVPPRPALKIEPAAPVDMVPVATRLAELAAHPDGAAAILDVALATGPAELRNAALARISQPELLVRIACEARAAETRHAAVLRILDEGLLAQVALQARTRDKRVYKVARERLDAYARERERQALQARWLETVETLAAQDQPELSRVMEVERVWAALQPDPDADQRFQVARARLQACFQAQAELRRQARRGGAEAAQEVPPATDLLAGEVTVQPAAEIHGGPSLASEAPAAPAPLSDGTGTLPASPPGASGESASAGDDGAAPDVIALPAEGEPTSAADARQAVTSAAQPATGKAESRRKRAADPALQEDIAREIEALEQALEEGHLHDAETRLEALSELQSRAGGVAGALGGRIRRAVEEIARLRAWRRWGGQQARDHLVDAAEALAARELPPEELGRAIKALRTQWQSIATSEGGAPHHLWERFDTACERAWEPVREHFARQAERRSENLARREALLIELEARVAALDAPPVDWRAIGLALGEASRRWRTLGPVDRKVAKSLEARHAEAVATLERRLRSVREAEATEREALIRRAEQLAERVDGRDTVTRLRELQAEWQVRARSVPLDRAREQGLWERFRAVCDGLFQARDAARAAEGAERAAQEQAESAAFRKRSELWRGLREAASACAAAERAVAEAGASLPERLPEIAASLRQAWSTLPEGQGREGLPLTARQQRLLAVCDGVAPSEPWRDSLAAVQAQLAQGILELEIALGLPSPAEVQDARRRLQLEKLADALRSGGRSDQDSLRRPALALCALPAGTAGLAQRLDAILQALAPQPPERRPMPARNDRPAGREGPRPDGGRGGRPGAGAPGREGRGGGEGRARSDAARAGKGRAPATGAGSER
jgi:hypothetical protein